MKKRLIAAVFAGSIALAACGSDDDDTSDNGDSPDDADTSEQDDADTSEEDADTGSGDVPEVADAVEFTETGYAVGAEADNTVVIYEDFGCNDCADLRDDTFDAVNEWAESGEAQVEFRITTDMYPEYSANVGSIVLAYAEEDPASLNAVVAELYQHTADQPELDEMFDLAGQAAGSDLSDEAREAVENGEYAEVFEAASAAADEDNAGWLPVVFVNGEQTESYTSGDVDIVAEVNDVLAGGGAESATDGAESETDGAESETAEE